MSRILVLGSSNIDLAIRAERLPAPGETVPGLDYYQAFGGKGANQAVAAARAGADVTFVAALGDDAFGRQAVEQYRREGLRTEWIKVVGERATGVALILVDSAGQNMIAVHPGANAVLGSSDIDALPERVFQENRVFVAQLETPVDAVRAALRRARGAGLLTILNPAPAHPLLEHLDWLPDVDILVPNETEASQLTAIQVCDMESARAAGLALTKRGPSNVILTMGQLGCVVVGDASGSESLVHIPALPTPAVDCVAAGDAFVGALACRLAEAIEAGKSANSVLIESAWWATHAASISVQRRGAQPSLPYRREIDQSHATARA